MKSILRKAQLPCERHNMAEVLAKGILKLMRGPIYVTRGPPFIAFVPKDPSVVFLKFNHEDSGISDKDHINLGSAAFIRNDDVPETEKLKTPRDRLESRRQIKSAAKCRRSAMPRRAEKQRDKEGASYDNQQ